MISVGTALKTILQLILFLVFLFDYGLPAIYKYLEEKTIRIKVKRQGDGIEAPAITLAAWNKDTSIGWLNKSKEIVHDFDSLRFQCKDFDDIVQCVTNQTYEQSDFVKDIIIGYEEKQSLLNSSNDLVEDFTNVRYGRTYTLNQDRRIGPDYEKDELIFLLEPQLLYSLTVHDKRFFLANENPHGIPGIYRKIDPGGWGRSRTHGPVYIIDVTRHKNLNLHDSPCEENPEYDFTACVKQSLSKKIGCRLEKNEPIKVKSTGTPNMRVGFPPFK